MIFFVDESGIFSNPEGKTHSISTVAVLGVPNSAYIALVHDIHALTASWGIYGKEVKGSLLAEEQVSQVLGLLESARCRLWASIIDTGLWPHEDTLRSRRIQARRILADLEQLEHHSMRAFVMQFAKTVLHMPPQLFVQLVATCRLIDISLRECLIHYALYAPQELGNMAWTIDAKNDAVTEAREFVEPFLCGGLQASAARDP